VQRGEPLVAGAGVVAPVLFQVPQEGDDLLGGQVAER
jgi:hypothetical protein